MRLTHTDTLCVSDGCIPKCKDSSSRLRRQVKNKDRSRFGHRVPKSISSVSRMQPEKLSPYTNRPQTERPKNWGSITDWSKTFSFFLLPRLSLEPMKPPLQWVARALSPGVNPNNHSPALVPRLRIHGVTPQFPKQLFLARCSIKHETTLPEGTCNQLVHWSVKILI